MKKRLLLLLAALFALTLGATQAQDDETAEDIPTVAIIRFGPLQPFELAEKGTLDLMAAYGYVDGENINYIFGDAAFDFPTANQLIEDAIDEEADYIIAITTPVAQAAVNATLDMENPPIVMFNTVTDPYIANLAESVCVKPAHVWGSQALAPYEDVVNLLFELNPDIETVGYIYNSAEANSVASTAIVQRVADELGLNLEIQTITETADVSLAAEAVVSNGAEAFLIPTDSTVSDGLPAILQVAEEVGIPLVHADSGQVYGGATVGFGLSYYQEGIDTARVLLAHLRGDIEIDNTGISRQGGRILALNLDSAADQDVDLPADLLDRADYVIQDGESTEETPELADMDMDERRAADDAFIANLDCSVQETDGEDMGEDMDAEATEEMDMNTEDDDSDE